MHSQWKTEGRDPWQERLQPHGGDTAGKKQGAASRSHCTTGQRWNLDQKAVFQKGQKPPFRFALCFFNLVYGTALVVTVRSCHHERGLPVQGFSKKLK